MSALCSSWKSTKSEMLEVAAKFWGELIIILVALCTSASSLAVGVYGKGIDMCVCSLSNSTTLVSFEKMENNARMSNVSVVGSFGSGN